MRLELALQVEVQAQELQVLILFLQTAGEPRNPIQRRKVAAEEQQVKSDLAQLHLAADSLLQLEEVAVAEIMEMERKQEEMRLGIPAKAALQMDLSELAVRVKAQLFPQVGQVAVAGPPQVDLGLAVAVSGEAAEVVEGTLEEEEATMKAPEQALLGYLMRHR